MEYLQYDVWLGALTFVERLRLLGLYSAPVAAIVIVQGTCS